MSYLAQGLMNGFGQGFAAGTQRERDEKRLAEDAKRRAMENRLREDAIMQKHAEAETARKTSRQSDIQANLRRQDAERARADEDAARAADPREQLARTKAERELAAITNPPPLTPAQKLEQDVARLKLEKERAILTGGSPAPAPTAKIRQPLGKGGYAEFEAPVSEIRRLSKTAAAEGYRSPVARQLADVEKQIAAQQSAIDGGDHRTGFLGLASRQDQLGNLTRERVRLQALDLQAKVKAGVLTQAEADEEADRLMTGTR